MPIIYSFGRRKQVKIVSLFSQSKTNVVSVLSVPLMYYILSERFQMNDKTEVGKMIEDYIEYLRSLKHPVWNCHVMYTSGF